jgi:competence ComEA-like helix-hairpin-helix protein
MKWKEFLRDYFTFSRKERIALLAVIVIIVGIWIFPKLSTPIKPNPLSVDTSWIIAAKQLLSRSADSDAEQKIAINNVDDLPFDKPVNERSSETKPLLFNFDPNVLPLEGWQRLGVPEKTIATIQKYLHKGGHFYKPEDLRKIYGIRPHEYTRLEPYITIATNSPARRPADAKAELENETFSNKPRYSAVDINTADTSTFVALPGIGSKLALRIVNFRDKLGGFYSVDQIAEIYGLPDSSFKKIKPFLKLESNPIKKFNINTASKDELKSHPYIKWNVANAIVEYRNQHGNFSSMEDLKNIALITPEVFDKIKFYLAL